MITGFITREAAEELFKHEAFLFSTTSEGVAQYRMIELFGEPAVRLMQDNMKYQGYLVAGEDFNAIGAASEERPMLYYFHKRGFMKFVSEHNYLTAMQEHRTSDGGKRADEMWAERDRELAEREAEEERKRQERKAKREAKARERKGVE